MGRVGGESFFAAKCVGDARQQRVERVREPPYFLRRAGGFQRAKIARAARVRVPGQARQRGESPAG